MANRNRTLHDTNSLSFPSPRRKPGARATNSCVHGLRCRLAPITVQRNSNRQQNSSFPRKRESSNQLIQRWIPAFAGMTRGGRFHTSPFITLHDTVGKFLRHAGKKPASHTKMHKEPPTAPRPHLGPQIMKNKGLGGGAGRFHRSTFAQIGIRP